MIRSQLESLFSRLGIAHSSARWGKKWVSLPCPFAQWTHKDGSDRHPSFGVCYAKQPPYFNCFSCGLSGDLVKLADLCNKYFGAQVSNLSELLTPRLADMVDVDDAFYSFLRDDNKMIYPSDYLDFFLPVTEVNDAVAYLRSRRVADEVIEKFNIRYDLDRDLLVVPVYDVDNRLRGAVGRSISGDRRFHNYWEFLSGANLGGINLVSHTAENIFVCEGFFDVFRIYPWAEELNSAAVCSFKASLSAGQASILSGFLATRYCCFDPDTAGNKGWGVCRSYGDSLGLNTWRRMCHELKDMGELTKCEFFRLFEAARDSAVSSFSGDYYGLS